MDDNGSLLERLRCSLADLEARQRVTGSTAAPDFFEPGGGGSAGDARTEPTPDAAGPGGRGVPADGAEPVENAEPADSGEPADPTTDSYVALSADWSVLSKVRGRLAPTLAFAAEVTAVRGPIVVRLTEADLVESANQLGRLQQAREVMLVKVVTELESRGVAAPGGLSRVDWLRTLDPTLTGAQAKAVATAATAFNQPRWQALRAAVTGESPDDKADEAGGGIDGGDCTGIDDGAGGRGEDGAHRVTVGKAAQVVDFYDRLRKVADPDELDQAVTHLTAEAASLRFEEVGQLVRAMSDQIRPRRTVTITTEPAAVAEGCGGAGRTPRAWCTSRACSTPRAPRSSRARSTRCRPHAP